MFLTHMDKDGNDTPAILIENSTAANRAVNIPEFVNMPPDGLHEDRAPVTDYYRVIDTASDLLKKNDYPAAAVEWSKALELEPDEALAHNNLGLALVETGKLDEGMAHYRKALELSPGYPEAYNNLGSALVRRRRLPEAVESFENALKSNPDHANAHVNLGAALAQMGRVDEAMPHLERGVELLPQDANAHTNLGLALAMKGQLDAAIPHLETALASNPELIREPVQPGTHAGGAGPLPAGHSALRDGGEAVERARAADPKPAGGGILRSRSLCGCRADARAAPSPSRQRPIRAR